MSRIGKAPVEIPDVIPKIDLDQIVVEGVSRDDLKDGPGHYPHTPLPGQPGNSAIPSAKRRARAQERSTRSARPDRPSCRRAA